MASFRIGVAATAGGFQMPSSLVRHPATLEHDPQAQQKREFDRRRTAIEIVQLMREAGIACELWDGFENHSAQDASVGGSAHAQNKTDFCGAAALCGGLLALAPSPLSSRVLSPS